MNLPVSRPPTPRVWGCRARRALQDGLFNPLNDPPLAEFLREQYLRFCTPKNIDPRTHYLKLRSIFSGQIGKEDFWLADFDESFVVLIRKTRTSNCEPFYYKSQCLKSTYFGAFRLRKGEFSKVWIFSGYRPRVIENASTTSRLVDRVQTCS